MKSRRAKLLAIVVGLGAAFSAGVVVGSSRGIPFVGRGEQWTIGIYRSDSPFRFGALQSWVNPRLRAEDVTDVSVRFVADPFLVRHADAWQLFFEVYNNETRQGDLSVATSKNLWRWKYERVILDEPFHLSYPYVFEWEGAHYLIPETFEANSIRLYRADVYPTDWSFVRTLVDGRDYVDNSIVFFQGRWWMFSSVTSNDALFVHYADSLLGPWQEHASSPVITNDLHRSRPSGRMIVIDGRLYRYTMDVNPPVGTHRVMAYEITELTPATYAERPVQARPVLEPDGSGWNGQAMHQIDPVQVGSNSWVAAVDGFGKYWLFGWRY
jgi:hypothetical protein